jgi:hypothetical protein
MESSDSQTYIGYSKQGDNVWTVEFNLTKPPENENIHFSVAKIKILQIEDSDGKLLRKVQNYTINSEYYLRKHPIRVFMNRTTLDFHKFYETFREKYDNYTGQVTEYYSDGNEFCTYYLVCGKLNGHFIAKKRNGDIIEESFFVDNMRHGITTYFCDYYEFHCEYNMGELINYDIKISDSEMYSIYENYGYNYNNGTHVDNGVINVNIAMSNYNCAATETEIAFTGTIHIENSKIVNSNITISSTYAKKIITPFSLKNGTLKIYYFSLFFSIKSFA